MHPSNCPCSSCIKDQNIVQRYDQLLSLGKMWDTDNIPAIPALRRKSYIVVKNNITSMKEFCLKCAICGGKVPFDSNYGVYEIIGQPENEPSFVYELCGESCMNLWRLKNAHVAIEVINNEMAIRQWNMVNWYLF